MTQHELFHDPLLAERAESDPDPGRQVPDSRETVDQAFQRSVELRRVQDELRKMARAGKRH